jgi:Putative sensor
MRLSAQAPGLLRRETRREATYALGSLGVGVLGSVVVTFGLIWSIGFAVFGLGFLLFLFVAAFCRRVSSWEARRASALVGTSWAPSVPPRTEVNVFERVVRQLRSKRTYADLALTALGGPTAIIGVVVVLGSWFLVVRALLEVVFIFTWPSAFDNAWGGSPLGALLVHTLPGAVAWWVGPLAIRATNRMRASTVLALSSVRDKHQPGQSRSLCTIS